MNVTYTLMLGEEEVDVDFNIEADITYEPARVSGPPEDCYPDSSECEITSIKVLSTVEGYTDKRILMELETQVDEDKIIDDLWEDYHSRGVDD